MSEGILRWDLRRYFVDEAGDPVLLNKHGTPVIGRSGCSTHFMLGFVEVDDEAVLAASLSALRLELQADQAFRDLPSMQPERRKTALAFHAKDDHVAVRTRVLDVLAKQRFRFYAVVRDKQRVLADLMALQRVVSGTRYSEDALYDAMVGRLLRDRLHVDECEITFARRGASNRTAALYRAIEQAKENFRQRWRQPTERQHTVLAASPHQYGGLQAADYCLWALQRLLVRREDAAWSRLAPHVVEVVLMDEPAHQDGRVFTQSQPLELRHVK